MKNNTQIAIENGYNLNTISKMEPKIRKKLFNKNKF